MDEFDELEVELTADPVLYDDQCAGEQSIDPCGNYETASYHHHAAGGGGCLILITNGLIFSFITVVLLLLAF